MRRGRALALALLATTGFGSVALAGATEPPKPPEDPLVELGRRLFFDPAASRTGMRSCADCHDPDHGWSDPERRSRDVRGLSNRHSQTLIDVGDAKRIHWDGEFASLEDLIRSRLDPEGKPPTPDRIPRGYYGDSARLDAPVEPPEAPFVGLGVPAPGPRPELVGPKVEDGDIDPVVVRLRGGHRYDASFLGAFGSSGVSLDRIVAAVAAFCRSIRSGESDYDRFRGGDATALSPSERRGLELFQGKAGCASCHSMKGRRPTFCDQDFHDTGVVWRAVEKRGRRPSSPDPEILDGRVDSGAMPVTERARDRRAFKTPTLRDVALHPPYMHDGSCATLDAAVRHYLAGPIEDPAIDPRMPAYRASYDDVTDLANFLRALTSRTRPGQAPRVASTRPSRARVRLLDARMRPLKGMRVTLTPAGDALADGVPTADVVRTTDEGGWVAYDVPLTTHVRVGLGGGLLPLHGDLVPDGCTDAQLVLPVAGVGRLRVVFAGDARVPESVFLVHSGARFFPDRRVPTTALERESLVEGKTGSRVAIYRGLVRIDVAAESRPWADALDGFAWPERVRFEVNRVAEVDVSE